MKEPIAWKYKRPKDLPPGSAESVPYYSKKLTEPVYKFPKQAAAKKLEMELYLNQQAKIQERIDYMRKRCKHKFFYDEPPSLSYTSRVCSICGKCIAVI